MPVHYHLPMEAGDKGFDVATPLGCRTDVPRLTELARELYPSPVEWLWPGRIPLGRVTLIEGASDSGKSFVAMSLAAIASAGLPWPSGPQGPREQSGVVLLTRQDHLHDTVAERLKRAGARIDVCYRFTHLSTWLPEALQMGDRDVLFPYDAPALGFIVDRLEDETVTPRLVVIDPLTDYCPTPAMVAAAISRLNEVAAHYGFAIVATLSASVAHDGEGRLRPRPGSRDGSARCVWCIEEDPDEPGRRLFVPTRMSFCEAPKAGLAFRIEDCVVKWEPETHGSRAEAARELNGVARWLRELLGGGDLPAADVLRQGHECGHTAAMLRTARRKAQVQVRRTGFGAEGRWLWSLGGEAAASDCVNGNGKDSHGRAKPNGHGGSAANGHAPANRVGALEADVAR